MKTKLIITILAIVIIAAGAIGGYAYNARQKAPFVAFQTYLAALQSHDLVAINGISHNQFSCGDTKEAQDACVAEWDWRYSTLSKINTDEYVNRFEDDKQIILTTNPRKNDSDDSKGYTKGIMFFTKDDAGKVKMLAASPNGGWGQSRKNTPLTEEQIEEVLQGLMLDTDSDGLTDQQEQCQGASVFISTCKQTDPAKRDTDGNGWWDGVEARFK